MMENDLTTARKFDEFLKRDDVDGAADLLADDFIFFAPRRTVAKAEWKAKFLDHKKDAPDYDSKFGLKDGKVQREGTKKAGFLKVKVVQTLQFEEGGKIKSISVRKA